MSSFHVSREETACSSGSRDLDLASLEKIFDSFPPNYLVLSVKPLSKHFRQWVKEQHTSSSNVIDASLELPLWVLQELGAASFSFNQQKQLLTSAAKRGDMAILDYLKTHRSAWDSLHCRVDTCEAATKAGNLDVVLWSKAMGCPWTPSIFTAAAEGGHIPVLQHLLDKKFSCGSDWASCLAAVG